MLTSDVGGAKNSIPVLSTLPREDPIPDLCVRDVHAGTGVLVSSKIVSNGAINDLVTVDL